MHVARVVIVLLVIFAAVAVYNPQVHQQALNAWENAKPVVMSIANSLYTTLRDLISSTTPRDGMDEKPVPGPGADFQRIVTMKSGVAF